MTDKIYSNEFQQAHRKNSADFTRNRTLTFPRLVSFMLNAINGSIQTELSRFFQVLDDSPVSLVTVSTAAFCKTRKKLSHSAFKDLNNTLVDTFYNSAPVQHWAGLRVLAVDGSVVQLPKSDALLKHFGKARERSFRPAIRMSQLYDIKNKITIDLGIKPHTVSERNMALKHLKHAKKGDVIVYDRGYPAVWFFKYNLINEIDFCSRVTLDSSNKIKEFVASGSISEVSEFPCVEKSL